MTLETPKMLVLSTGHVTPKTARYLRHHGYTFANRDRMPIFFDKGDVGWILPILPDAEENLDRWEGFNDLAAIRTFALENGCSWIMLDRDADVVPTLQTYEEPMSRSAYIDGIIDLLERAGVPAAEIEAKKTEMSLSHAFTKGVSFDCAAKAVFKTHGVELVGEA